MTESMERTADSTERSAEEGAEEGLRLLLAAAELAQWVIEAPGLRRSRDDVAADHAIDDAVVAHLSDQGLAVYSEESGRTVPARPGRYAVLIDPLDGSRNFRLGVPWYAFSACLLTDGTPAAAVVRNLATGQTTRAIRGVGAWTEGGPTRVDPVHTLAEARALYSGYPGTPVPAVTSRDLGASALDLCAVARGDFHLSLDLTRSGTDSWDHAAGMLIAEAAGAALACRRSAPGRFGTGVFARRHLVAASSPALLAEAVAWSDRWGPR
ncbi:inositol monophosphatase family protein [Kitasatospora sp. NPDC058063]|uniref:inositol monophosphatase family protein n=1 Tax=unclassified Kitasatospora TaxID=2633591 RepID=UPI0036DC2221